MAELLLIMQEIIQEGQQASLWLDSPLHIWLVVAGFTAAYMARSHFTRAKKWVQDKWANRPEILGGNRKLTLEEAEKYAREQTKKLLRTKEHLKRFAELKNIEETKLTKKDKKEQNELKEVLTNRYVELEKIEKIQRTSEENDQYNSIIQALSIAQISPDEE